MIAIYKDTNTLNEESDNRAINELEKLVVEYPDEISIDKTSVMDTELKKNASKNAKRLHKSSEYIESYEVAVLNVSRLGYGVLGSGQDDQELTDILSIIFGEKPRSSYKQNDLRDALHIHTVIRHGGSYFITYDKKLLRRSKEIKERFNSIIICKPEKCLELVLARIKVLKDAGHWQNNKSEF